MPAVIFVTDNDRAIRGAILKRLARQGHHAVGYESGEALLEGMQHSLPDLVLLDVKMPGLSGLETLKQVRRLAPASIVIMLTAYGTVQDAVDVTKLGAYDFIIKSVDLEGLDTVIAEALEVLHLRQRLEPEPNQQERGYRMNNLEAHSPAMLQLLEQVRQVAERPKSSMMLPGEAGTGKEFLAQVIHHDRSLVVGLCIGVNFTAIPKESFESQWFGFERGASTSAN
jgi:two-component system, NtrC family, response regulator AtoC